MRSIAKILPFLMLFASFPVKAMEREPLTESEWNGVIDTLIGALETGGMGAGGGGGGAPAPTPTPPPANANGSDASGDGIGGDW